MSIVTHMSHTFSAHTVKYIPPNTINKIQSGVVILYKHLNIKVVPIKLNSGKYWGKNSFLKYPGKIIVEFLKPIKPGLSPGEFRKRLEKLL